MTKRVTPVGKNGFIYEYTAVTGNAVVTGVAWAGGSATKRVNRELASAKSALGDIPPSFSPEELRALDAMKAPRTDWFVATIILATCASFGGYLADILSVGGM